MIMRNSFHPPLPSEFFSIGSSDFPLPSLNVSTVKETKMNAHTSCFYSEPQAIRQENQGVLSNDHYQPNPNSQAGHQYVLPSRDAIPPPPTKKLPVLQSSNEWQPLFTAQKRRLETDEHVSEEEINDFQSQEVPSSEWKRNKRKKVNAGEHNQSQVPVRRSQKIGDKITALQKLVSPYGKTDTASVLQEASLYIKLLHEQIRNLFQMLSSSYISIRALHPEENTTTEMDDLRSKGLCLVPVSYIKEVDDEDKHKNM